MSKQTGIVSNLYVDDANVSGDVGAINSITLSRALLDYTGIDKDFMERLPGLGDGSISFTGFFNNTGAHAELGAMATATRAITCTLGTAAGDAAASLYGAVASYETTRGADGALTFSTSASVSNGYGVEWGKLLTNGMQTFAGSGTSASVVDEGAATTNGGAAFLHAQSIGSGTATIVLQHSDDNSTFASITGGTFAAFSTAASERIALSGTINRYTRVNATGTFGTAVFAVNLIRD